jgi:hypothetical protein
VQLCPLLFGHTAPPFCQLAHKGFQAVWKAVRKEGNKLLEIVLLVRSFLGKLIMDARQNARNCEELAIDAEGPTRKRFARLAEGWRDVANAQDWLDGRESREEDPHETPEDDPRQKTDAPNTKQTESRGRAIPKRNSVTTGI